MISKDIWNKKDKLKVASDMNQIVENHTYPTDWEEKKLGDLGVFLKGKGISKNDKKETGYPCILYGEIYTRHHNYIKDFYSFIDEETASKSMVIKKGDILFAGSGETKEEIGKSVAYLDDTVAYAGGDIIILRTKDVNAQYLAYSLNHGKLAVERAKLGQGHSVVHIYSKELTKLSISLPLIEEQNKIVSILSSWDKAIELKEKLIKQKKEQKKGLMQKLITGDVRLAGFQKAWKEGSIKDLGILKGGNGFPEKYQNYNSGKYPFFKVSDMNKEGNEKYLDVANNYISEKILSEIKATIIPKNSIVFAKVGAALLLERKRILKEDSCIDNNMMALTPKSTIDFTFVYYLLLNSKLSKVSNVGALPSMNATDVYKIKCKFPSDYLEQKAIGELLSMFDREIDTLMKEVVEIKKQKSGLMQQLLTGKIRVKV